MATTASGVTIPGASPTTTAATPIQDHWNNLGKSLNGHIVVPVASVTARAALVTALAAEGYTISAANPLYTHRADAPLNFELEVTVDGTTWRSVGVSTLPHLRIKQASAQSRPGTSWGQVAFGTTADTAGAQPWTESAGAITLTSAGLYNIDVTVSMSAASFAVMIYDATSGAALAEGPVGSGVASESLSTMRRLAAGAAILVRVYPSSTLNVMADSATTPTSLSITKLSD